MGRFCIGIALMAVLLGIGLYSAHAIEQSHEPIAALLEQAAQAADPEQAAQFLQQANDRWKRRWHGTAVLSDHGPMDEIDSLFSQAQSYAQTGKREDFSAFCLRLAQLICATADEHQPTWWNFL